jgi:hypothetical protein
MIQIKIDFKALIDKVNIYKKIQIYLTNKLNEVRQEWFKLLNTLEPDSPCSTLTLIKVEFGLTGYRIIHKSGLLLAIKPYFRHKSVMKLNKLNIVKAIFQFLGVDIDFDKGIVTIKRYGELLIGRPEGIVVSKSDYTLVFIFSNSDVTKHYRVNFNSCRMLLVSLIEQTLPHLFKVRK